MIQYDDDSTTIKSDFDWNGLKGIQDYHYEDKPTDRVDYYNSFWCAFAFRRRNFYECINFMEKSTLKQKHTQNEITQTPLFGSKVIEVANYIDLGTWPEIRRLLIDYEKDSN